MTPLEPVGGNEHPKAEETTSKLKGNEAAAVTNITNQISSGFSVSA
jgi:hypothetical protein